MKPHILRLHQLSSLLSVYTTNIISVPCHYCGTEAGNVSPAHFPVSTARSSTRVLRLHQLPLHRFVPFNWKASITSNHYQVFLPLRQWAFTHPASCLNHHAAEAEAAPAAYFPTISCTSALPPQIQRFHIQN